MDYPLYFKIGDTKILWHMIAEPLGMFIGFRYFLFLRKKQGDLIENSNRIWVLIGAVFGAIMGSRLIGGLEDPPAMLQAKNHFIHFYQNKTVLGGFLGGLWGVEIIKKIIKEKHSSGDLFTYPMILALIIGRLGCFSMGVYEETYGTVTSFFTGMYAGDGQLRHPVTLYEIVFLLVLWVGLVKTEKKYQLAEGLRFKVFMIAYIVFRLLLDYIKPHYTFSFGLSTIQVTCIVGLLYYLVIYFQHKELFLIKEIDSRNKATHNK